MPITIWTEDEHNKIVSELKAKNLELSKRLSRRVSREEFGKSIGGFGCILDDCAESDYCCGCPAEDLCSYEYKRLPK